MKINTHIFGILIIIILGLLNKPPFALGLAQVSHLQAEHRAGQTFLTWSEIAPDSLPQSLSVPQLKKLQSALIQDEGLQYFVYRSQHPITSLEGLTPIAAVEPLSGWNVGYYGKYPKVHDMAFRYVIEEGNEPIGWGRGLFVFSPQQNGPVYYAVTSVVKGNENRVITPENSLKEPVRETVNLSPPPILQKMVNPEKFQFVGEPTLHYYVRWDNPPNSNVPGNAFNYLVAIPHDLSVPAAVGIHLHAWGGNLNKGYGWWYNADQGSVLVSTNQFPYDWWTGYHEKLNLGLNDKDGKAWKNGVVKPYTQRRLLSFLDWVSTQWTVDLTRTFVAGNSMGGSGALMLAIRFPERIAWAMSWLGIHKPAGSPQFKSSYTGVFGKPEWGVKFEDGTPVWDYFNDVWYLKAHPQHEVGFLTFSNGKNDAAIGWSQAVEFYEALQETKRPHLFVWGQAGHGQRARMPMSWTSPMARQGRNLPIDIRIDQTLPAFTHSSFDDVPGSGDPNDGDAEGQVNAHLYWLTDDIVDASDRWEMTVGVGPDAPAENGTVDITPRRCQQFHPQPGMKVFWKNQQGKNGETVQSGQVAADKWGLVTLKGVLVSQGLNRVSIYRSSEP